MADLKIKDAPLVESVGGTEKIPVSDGSGQPKAVTTDKLKEFAISELAPYVWSGTTSITIFEELKAAIEANRTILWNGNVIVKYSVTDSIITLYDVIYSETNSIDSITHKYNAFVAITTSKVSVEIRSGVIERLGNSYLSIASYNKVYVKEDTTFEILTNENIAASAIPEYQGEFYFGDSVFEVNFPDSVFWSTDSVTEFQANRTYQFKIINRTGRIWESSQSLDEKPDYSTWRGVFIQDIDGFLYTYNDWDGTKTPNGIAVLTDNCRFVMALNNAHSTNCTWGGYSTEVSGITTSTSINIAKTDYDGEAQTTTILNELGNDSSSAPAAYYCRAYIFPNGSKGYMGTVGEWVAVLDNKDAITIALSQCGGTAMSYYYWTSTQYSSNDSWYMYWSDERLSNSNKYYNRYVRAFSAI